MKRLLVLVFLNSCASITYRKGDYISIPEDKHGIIIKIKANEIYVLPNPYYEMPKDGVHVQKYSVLIIDSLNED